MPKAWTNYHGESACPYHRLLLPGRFCAEAFEKYGWNTHIGEGMPPGYDVYFFHGLPNELALIEIAKVKRRAKFVWSVDDDWTSIPDWNPAKPNELGLSVWNATKILADWIVVSTPHLASTFSDVSEKVMCAPNMLDMKMFPDIPFTTGEDGRRDYEMKVEIPVRVAWVGGHTHTGDMEVMTEALHKLIEKYDPSKMVVIFQGQSPPSSLLMKYLHRGLFHQPPVPFASYQKVLNSIRPAIYLAPLAPIEFNLSKSNLRVMEGWALNAAVVASDWGEYTCIKNGYDGRVASNTDEWFSALDRLVKDHEYRLSIALEGRNRIEREYSWGNPQCRREWYKVFSTIYETPDPADDL